MVKKMYIGKEAKKKAVFFKRENVGLGYGAGVGIGGDTTKCLWCGKYFNATVASCGTGTTWSLYKCPHCKRLMADGNIIPSVVKNDPEIRIKIN